MNLKVLSDQECNLYIDCSLVSTIPANELTIIPMKIGEYIIKYECKSFPFLFIEKDLFIQYDTIERISFQDEINNHPELFTTQQLFPKNKEGLWGYILENTNLWIISPSYDSATPFWYGQKYNKLAIVSKNGTYAIINKKNELVIPFGRYTFIEECGQLSYTTLFIGKDHDYCYWVINEKGIPILSSISEPIICEDFITIDSPKDSRGRKSAFYLDGSPISILEEFDNSDSLSLFDLVDECHYYFIEKNGLTGIVNVNNTYKTAIWIKPGTMIEKISYMPFGIGEEYGRYLYGFYDPSDNIHYEYHYYSWIKLLVEFRLVKARGVSNNTLKYDVAIYDKDGKTIFERSKLNDKLFFIDGYALFKENNKSYSVNKDGIVIGPYGQYAFWSGYLGGYAVIVNNGKHGLIDIKGRLIIPCQYDYIDWKQRYSDYIRFGNRDVRPFVIIGDNKKQGVFSIKEEKLIVPVIYEKIEFKDDSFDCQSGDMHNIYDQSGKEIK